jgi:hypothetical protein
MKRSIRILGLLLLAAFLILQVRQPDRTNPPSDPAEAIASHLAIPGDVQAIFDRSCRDCHSHDTRWPLYAYVAPVSWQLAEHVAAGRQELNFSTWGQYDGDAVQDLLTAVCRQIRAGDMPLRQYLRFHPSARLSADDISKVCAWTAAERRRLREAE